MKQAILDDVHELLDHLPAEVGQVSLKEIFDDNEQIREYNVEFEHMAVQLRFLYENEPAEEQAFVNLLAGGGNVINRLLMLFLRYEGDYYKIFNALWVVFSCMKRDMDELAEQLGIEPPEESLEIDEPKV